MSVFSHNKIIVILKLISELPRGAQGYRKDAQGAPKPFILEHVFAQKSSLEVPGASRDAQGIKKAKKVSPDLPQRAKYH